MNSDNLSKSVLVGGSIAMAALDGGVLFLTGSAVAAAYAGVTTYCRVDKSVKREFARGRNALTRELAVVEDAPKDDKASKSRALEIREQLKQLDQTENLDKGGRKLGAKLIAAGTFICPPLAVAPLAVFSKPRKKTK